MWKEKSDLKKRDLVEAIGTDCLNFSSYNTITR